MTLGATIEASIYIVVVLLCLSDCFRAVVEETQVDSILDWWSVGATWSMHLVLTRRLSVCVYIITPYFPSKKVYIFICEWGVSAYGKNRITLWVFETNKPHRLQRRNHKLEEQIFLLLFLCQDVSQCLDIRHRSSQILRVTPFAIL